MNGKTSVLSGKVRKTEEKSKILYLVVAIFSNILIPKRRERLEPNLLSVLQPLDLLWNTVHCMCIFLYNTNTI